MMGTCLDCEENFELGDEAEIGDIVECPACKTRLEVLDLHPVVLDYALEGDGIEDFDDVE